MPVLRGLSFALLVALACVAVRAEDSEPVPHGQQQPPGPALSPAEALAKMTVPKGFHVELVASEPEIVNPVAMTFDERGRIWITESLEYPRREPGPGEDRVKILEDTDHDGRADKFTIFANGLNIPSGIAVGGGGVWVANSPDLLFMRDTDGDDVADTTEVVLTGFGRQDTHELPNSLTWGPDGWLYGLNGVFNPSHVEYRGRTYDFTCALFRVHPQTRDFEIFCEGTSNPWGVAFDSLGSAFVSACVIDHLWHLVESGYYHRQGGPYPAFTWKLGSIVEHKHQQAAYCGIHYFDSDAYPAAYRDKLYMGNIHGNCINADSLTRVGSTYRGETQEDLLSAHDAWFMPVVQKTGPDGCLYVLDWYDRYHCYQDANRDPRGIDRLKGRLYRIRYKNTPRAPAFDLSQESDDELIQRLHSPNVYFRDVAQRLLRERATPDSRAQLQRIVLGINRRGIHHKTRMHALWALLSVQPLDAEFHRQLLTSEDDALRAWGVRAAGNARQVAPDLLPRIASLASDPSPDVQVQVAIASRKLPGLDATNVLLEVAAHAREDVVLPHIVWQNLYPLILESPGDLSRHLDQAPLDPSPALVAVLSRAFEVMLARASVAPDAVVQLYQHLASADEATRQARVDCLAMLAQRIQTREISGDTSDALKQAFQPILSEILAGPADGPLFLDAALLATSWRDNVGLEAVRGVFSDRSRPDDLRLRALAALVGAQDQEVFRVVSAILGDPNSSSTEFRRRTLDALGRWDEAQVATVVLDHYQEMEADLRPQAVELLTGRATWSNSLLDAIADKRIPAEALNLNQVRKLLASQDQALVERVTKVWGSLRTERNASREQVMARMRAFLRRTPGDAHQGREIFKKVCGQCHKMHGQGQEVGPDITVNGRASFEQLLSNVFDPSLVIGASYQARTLVTADGQILTGLLVEESEQRVVLKVQGGKLETVARGDVEQLVVSKLSLMPEDLEKQLKPQELADLFAYIALDRPPEDAQARELPGFREALPRESENPADFDAIVAEVAPGFSVAASGEGGVAIVAEHAERKGVLRTHPVARNQPCFLTMKCDLPADLKCKLLLDVSHDARGDWRLVIQANGQVLHDTEVSEKSTREGWQRVEVDLSSFAGQSVDLQLANQATGWTYEFGYWSRVEIVSE